MGITKKRKYKLRVVIPAVLLVAIFIVAALVTVTGWSRTLQHIKQEQMTEVENQAATLYDSINRRFAILDGYSASFTREQLSDHEAMLEKLERCVQNTEFDVVCFAYPNGTMYRQDGVYFDVEDRDYFYRAIQGGYAVQYMENSAIDAQNRVALAVPVIIQGQVEGVLLGLFDEEAFQTIFERVTENARGLSYLCDSTGAVLTSTEVGDQFMAERDMTIKDGNIMNVLSEADFTQGSKEETEALMRDYQSGQIDYTYQGERRYVTFVPVGINDWYILSALYESQIYDDAMGVVGLYAGIIFLFMLMVLIIIIYLLIQTNREARKEKKRGEEIQYLLDHDPVTGILSERAFLEQVSERLPELRRDEYCLVYLDIYKFKLINEMFGYAKGDELLRAMGEELEKFARRVHGLCARIGGDSFVLFLPHWDDVIQEFHTKKYRKKRIVPVELYIHYGVYVIQDTGVPADRMVDCARLAQKTVKGSYTNCVAYYDTRLRDKNVQEQEIITSMEKALANGEFIIYLQPQYDYSTHAIYGAEALVRWNSPTKGLIPPGEFIPVFEANGFITTLDEYVWEQVCRLQREWLDEGKKVFPLSVNVSRADLLQGGIAEKLTALIEKYALDPGMLRVEITESAYMDNPEQMIQEINALVKHGFSVEMDDFGSGYSSLNMLKDVPVHVLKTDLKFLSTTGDESRKGHILGGIIRMAHEMGMEVIAEGVETKEQADYLLSLNCEQMQGYYFSRPVPVEEYESMVYSESSDDN